MRIDEHQKVTPSHLKRGAYLYIRQSTLRQVMENTESTQRQYALRERAVALGWPVESVVTIDSDLGHSGSSTVDREGFQGLVTEVGLGKAGVVMGLEVSRLARNSADWHRLLEICAVTDNQRRLIELAQVHGRDRYKSPPREGPALLQGLVMCGICGGRMVVHYHTKNRQMVPEYVCQKAGIEKAQRICQRMMGDGIDEAVGELLTDSMKPMALEVAMAVQQELQSRIDEADRLRMKQVERARYESELARRRYMQVDPDNRLVADVLEAEWNEKLKTLTRAQEEYERAREADRVILDDEKRKQIMALATDFPRLWNNPKTPQRERKRMIRLLIEDVTLIRESQITAHVRFKGGATRTLTLPISLGAAEMRKAKAELVQEVDRLIDDYTDCQIAGILRDRGTLSPTGLPFTAGQVAFLRNRYKLKPRYDRLREKGLLTLEEMAQALGIATYTVKTWRRWGLLTAYYYNDKNQCLYEFNPDNRPEKFKHKESKLASNPRKGVQYEA